MATSTDTTSRTAHLLELMTKGDEAFNARDFEAVDAVHHPDMIAFITGLAEPVYGREARRSDATVPAELPRHARKHPVPDSVRKRRLDHRRHPRHGDLHRRDDSPRRQRHFPDGEGVRRRVRPDHQV